MKNIIILFVLFFGWSALAQDAGKIKPVDNGSEVSKAPKFVEIEYVISKKKDSLAKILRRFVKEDSVINKKTPMVKKILGSNAAVKNWRKLKKGDKVKIFLSPEFIDPAKMKAYREKQKLLAKKDKTKKKKKRKKRKRRKKIAKKKWNVFYMASMGTFAQENNEYAKVEFKQNSPITLGLMYTHHPKKKNYSIASSAYFSYLLAATSNLDTGGDVEVPLEIGFNSYYQQKFRKKPFSVYGGFDFERFSTFNLVGLDTSGELDLDVNQIGFVTAGYSHGFMIKKRFFLFKTSISQSVFSSRAVGFSGDSDTTSYTGNKFMLFFMGQLNKKFTLSTLFKYHILKGPSDVSILRIGFGAGYSF